MTVDSIPIFELPPSTIIFILFLNSSATSMAFTGLIPADLFALGIANGKFNRVVVWQDRSVKDVSLDSIAGKSQTLSKTDPLIDVARGLGIYIGDLN